LNSKAQNNTICNWGSPVSIFFAPKKISKHQNTQKHDKFRLYLPFHNKKPWWHLQWWPKFDADRSISFRLWTSNPYWRRSIGRELKINQQAFQIMFQASCTVHWCMSCNALTDRKVRVIRDLIFAWYIQVQECLQSVYSFVDMYNVQHFTKSCFVHVHFTHPFLPEILFSWFRLWHVLTADWATKCSDVLDFSTVPLQQNSLSQLRVRKIFFRSFVAKLPKRQQLFKDVFLFWFILLLVKSKKILATEKKSYFPKKKFISQKNLKFQKKNLIFR
jgi:hypothetical protein